MKVLQSGSNPLQKSNIPMSPQACLAMLVANTMMDDHACMHMQALLSPSQSGGPFFYLEYRGCLLR